MLHSLIFNRFFKMVLVLGVFTLVNGCDGWMSDKGYRHITESSSANSAPTKIRTLKVLVVPGKYSYYRTPMGREGLESDILATFAFDSGYKIQWFLVSTEGEGLLKLRSGQYDLMIGRIAAHWISETEDVRLGPAYDQSDLIAVCPKKLKLESSFLSDLHISKNNYESLSFVTSRKQSPPAQRKAFKERYPETRLTETVDESTFKLFKRVSSKQFNCALVDSKDADFELRKFATLEKKQTFGRGSTYHFLMNRSAENTNSEDLQIELQSWILKNSRNGDIKSIQTRYNTHLTSLHFLDVKSFYKAFSEKLPKYLREFKRASVATGLPWQLIAAVAYQESHWNADAKSYTGVRGLMQLTQDTAEHMGVDDRTNPAQSIHGGAKYLKWLWDSMPDTLSPRERLNFTLAAYNIGLGHLDDVQSLVEKNGDNPFAWRFVRDALPSLEEESVGESLAHGTARGSETVDFVHSVLNFYDLILGL